MSVTVTPLMYTPAHPDPYGLVGGTFSEGISVTDALAAGDLNWTVRLENNGTYSPENGFLEVPDKRTTVRVEPNGRRQALATVGRDYAVLLQNEEFLEVAQNVVHASGGSIKAAGHTKGGRRTFAQIALPEGIKVGGVDRVDQSLVLVNSHDGSVKLGIWPTSVRWFCMNQMPLITSGLGFTASHRASTDVSISAIREQLQVAYTELKQVGELGEKLVDRPLSDLQLRQVIPAVYRMDQQDPEHKHQLERITTGISTLFTEAPNLANVRGTAWAGLQAIIEYEDHRPRLHRPAERIVSRVPLSELIKTRAIRQLLPA